MVHANNSPLNPSLWMEVGEADRRIHHLIKVISGLAKFSKNYEDHPTGCTCEKVLAIKGLPSLYGGGVNKQRMFLKSGPDHSFCQIS